mgnify:CR=1 FL=1
MKLKALYRDLQNRLEKAPNADPGFEAFYLLRQVLGISRRDLYGPDREVSEEHISALYRLTHRRLGGEPLQYLLGEWEFFGLPMAVGPGVLIPRPETELLAELALAELAGLQNPRVLDLCSGTGCIPVAVAKHRPDALVWGVELSEEALPYFRRNTAQNGAANVTVVAGDALDPPEEVRARQVHVITCNPPYVTREEMAALQTEVTWEPPMALDGGVDGLDFYRRLPGVCLPLLEPGGLLLLEIGETQGPAVAALLAGAGFGAVEVRQDLGGLDRVVTGRKPG